MEKCVGLLILFTLMSCASSQSFVLEEAKEDGEYRLKNAAPVYYPAMAMKEGIEGWVELQYDINTKGDVQNIVVIQEQPKAVFTEAAISALKATTYYPSVKDGNPTVTMSVRRTIKFMLTADPNSKDCEDVITDAGTANKACKKL